MAINIDTNINQDPTPGRLVNVTSITMLDGATIGQAAGPKVEFDDTNNYLEITGCNVGIGTTGPGAKLDVSGTGILLQLNQTTAESGADFLFSHSENTKQASIGFKANVAGNDLTFNTYDGSTWTEGLRIKQTGNVGIGTTSPQNLVHAVSNPATTNTIIDVARLDRTTSGTAADGIGCGLVLHAEDASGNVEEAANIDAVFTTAAHATQVGELHLGVMGTDIVAIDSKKNVVLSPAAIATNATDGFTYIPTCAGAPTGVPTTKTGTVALVFDTSNNKLYVYDGGWLNVTLAA